MGTKYDYGDIEALADSPSARPYQGEWDDSGKSYRNVEGKRVALSDAPSEDEEEARDDTSLAPSNLMALLQVLPEMIEHLTAKQRFVLERRWGLNGGEAYSQEEIAAAMGVTHQAVSKIEESAYKALQEAHERRCAHCGGSMVGKRRGAKACSDVCQKALARKSRKAA